jgi:hypothetical protein
MEELKYKVGIETDRIEPADLIDPGAISALVEINDQIEQYKNELKALAEVEKEQGQLSENQKKQQEQLKLALKDAQNEYRNVQKSIQTVDAAVQSSIKTYDGLVKENKALMDAMRQLPLDDTTGELERLQAQFNANNDELKKFDATLGNHQRNVGNYKSGLGGITDSLSDLPGPIGGAVASVKTLNTVLKANPIGLVIAAVAGLIAMLSKLQPVVDFVNKSFAILTNSVQFFVQKAGGFLGIIEQTDDTLGEVIKKTNEIANAEVRIRDAKRAQTVSISEQQKQISKLRLVVADITKSEQERLDAANKVEKIEKQMLADRQKLATEELNNAKEKLSLDKTNIQLLDLVAEKQAAFNQAEIDSNNFNRELIAQKGGLQNAIDAEAKANAAELARIRQQGIEEERKAIESLATARQDVDQKMIDSLDKMREGEFEIAIDLMPKLDTEDLTQKSMLAATLLNNTLKEQTIARLEEEGLLVESAELQKQFRIQELTQMFIDAKVDANQAALDAEYQANLEYAEKFKQIEEGKLALAKQVEEGKKQAAISAASSIVSIGESLFGKTKGLAVAQAIIDTFAAANSAAKNTPGGVIVKSLAAAAMIAKGIVNVKKILSTKPGGGASIGGGSSAGSAMSTAGTLSPAGIMTPQSFSGQSPFATGMASSVGDPAMNRGEINIQANVDRRGLAIAVREGERSIRTQQFDYR